MTTSPNSLLQYLPAIYHEDPFLAQFLKAFEKVLLGLNDGQEPKRGLEEIIAEIATLFDPYKAPDKPPENFLPWLASWVAFTLRADLKGPQQKDFIAKIIQRYRARGTKQNLAELLKIFILGEHRVVDGSAGELQIGVHSTVGEDTYIGGGPAHFFRVFILMPQVEKQVLERQMEIADSLINLEKPAHTNYELKVESPTMRIGKTSTVGVNTLLGTTPAMT